MAHLLLGHCKVAMHQMQDFTTRIQNWEQDVEESGLAPDFHGFYLQRDDPSDVVIELRFSNQSVAEACIAAGHIDRLRREVMECTDFDPGSFIRYELFYGAADDGERVIFGEPAHERHG